MYKVCVCTTSRSDYGLLKWTMRRILLDNDLKLQVVVTGSHLSKEHGLTYRYIEKDKFIIDAKVNMPCDNTNTTEIAKSMWICGDGMANCLSQLRPNLLIVLGDRYELLPIVNTALIMNIPIAHISGGDITEGAIDNEIRNAVTMMAQLHFPGVEASAMNIIRMKNCDENVFTVGEPGLENFKLSNNCRRSEIAERLSLNPNKKWWLVTLHPETKLSLDDNIDMCHNLYTVISSYKDVEIVLTKANADYGGKQINDFWESQLQSNDFKNIHLFSSLGQTNYINVMRESSMVIGNSSSGIVETPFLGIPTLNIGDRQKGRYICTNVVNCGRSIDDIKNGIEKASIVNKSPDFYYGDGNTSEIIVNHIKQFLSCYYSKPC